MANKPLLFTIAAIIGLISLAISSTIPSSAPDEAMAVIEETATEAPADEVVEADVPTKASMEEQLVGTWVQAERGGEDGRTSCGDAEIMTTLNAGETVSIEFYRNGKVDYTLWYDTKLKNVDGKSIIKAAYNSGTWTLEGTQLNESWPDGPGGGGIDNLGASEDHFEISIDGNVMTQSKKDGITRFVRCL